MRGGHPGEEETVEASVQGGMPAAERRVEAMVARHGAALMRVANQFSLCHDDALDAYQRALEIYLRRLDRVEAATEAHGCKRTLCENARDRRPDAAGQTDGDNVVVVCETPRT